MHDKGRTLQDYKRRMWLQELLDEVHTADVRQLPVRTASGGGGGGAGGGPGGPGPSTTLHPKGPGGTKNVSFKPEDEGGTNLPQETNKSPEHKDGGGPRLPGKKKKKDRSGKRRDGEKKRRRARSSDPRVLRLDWSSLLGGF